MNYKCPLTILFAFITLTLSCGRKNEQNDKPISDSLINATENIAFAGADFGISKQQFYQQYPNPFVRLGGRSYKLVALFKDEGKLNSIYLLDSTTVSNTKFDQALFDKMDSLKQYFVGTYGEPQYNRGYPRQQNMRNGNAFDTYKWKVGKKTIAVGIALEEKDGGNIYYIASRIEIKK